MKHPNISSMSFRWVFLEHVYDFTQATPFTSVPKVNRHPVSLEDSTVVIKNRNMK